MILASSEFLFAKALWAALLIGLLLPVLGRNLVLGRTILLGLAIPQIAMAGIAFVFLGHALEWKWALPFEEDSTKALVGSLLFGLPGLILVAAPWQRRSGLSEAWLAFLYLASVAATNLMLSNDAVGETYLSDLFHGRLLFISEETLRLLAVVLCSAAFLALAMRRRLLLVLTDPDYAVVSGLRVGAWTLLGTLLSGTTIGVTVAAAGPLVTFAFLVLPVLAAGSLASSLRANLWLSMAIGLLTAWAGFHISYHHDLPLGDTVVAAGCGSLLLAKGIGLLRSACSRLLAARSGK